MPSTVANLLNAALTSGEALCDLLPDVTRSNPLITRLKRLSAGGPIVLDVYGAESRLSANEMRSVVLAIRDHWHTHGFCMLRVRAQQQWNRVAYELHQPLLCWRALDAYAGWDLLGLQLQGRELDLFRFLASSGSVTVEQVASNPLLFSQEVDLGDWRVQQALTLGRRPPDPLENNTREAVHLLRRFASRRLVVQQTTERFAIVRLRRDERR
jgi:hypothetical protein